jgi:ligand-binding SRPBCC domain-containing protein
MFQPYTSRVQSGVACKILSCRHMLHHAQFEQWVPFPLERVFLFFTNPGNLPRIMPPKSGAELLRLKLVPPPGVPPEQATVSSRDPVAGTGSEITASFRIVPFLPLRGKWVAQITEFEWNHHFADVQKKGPFKYFHHRHEFTRILNEGEDGTTVRDIIEYEVGYGFAGEIGQKVFVRRQFEDMFTYRQQALIKLLGVKGAGGQFLGR